MPPAGHRLAAVLAASVIAAAACTGPTDEISGRPRPAVQPEQLWAATTLAGMTLEQKVGQLFVSPVYGATADATDQRNRAAFGVDTPSQVVSRYHLGGVVYFEWSSPLHNPRQVAMLSNGLQAAALRAATGIPLIISVDQENGAGSRIGPPATVLPGAHELGITGSADDAKAAAMVAGSELRAMGINTDLAPVADVNVNPANPVIGPRSFSADPATAARLTGAQVIGYQESVAATAKHFPGHGDTTVDSHSGLPVIDHDREQWERLDAPPFKTAIAAGVDAIMTGHLALPRLDPSGDPATLSPEIVTGLLRGELGFTGVVITDSLRMRGVRSRHPDDRIPVLAIKAGVDVLLMPPDLDLAYRSVLSAVHSGELTEQRIDASVTRVLKLKHRRGIVDRPMTDVAAVHTVVGSSAHRAIANQLAANSAQAARGSR